MTGGVFDDGAGGALFVAFYAQRQGARAQPVLYVARDRPSYERHAPAFQYLVASLSILPRDQQPPARAVALEDAVAGTLAAAPPPPAAPSPSAAPGVAAPAPPPAEAKAVGPSGVEDIGDEVGPRIPGGLDGLYIGPSIGISFESHRYAIFYADGVVGFEHPSGGLDGFDRGRAARKHPDAWSRYRVEGKRVIVTKYYGTQIVGQLLEDGSVRFSGIALLLPWPKATGLLLEGTYQYGSEDRSITFRRDGTFMDHGALRVVADFVDDTFREVPPGGGTYRISNNTLWLTYPDGTVLRNSFLVAQEDVNRTRPDLIAINTYELDLVR